MDLIDKALRLCEEIEERQARLKEILERLREEKTAESGVEYESGQMEQQVSSLVPENECCKTEPPCDSAAETDGAVAAQALHEPAVTVTGATVNSGRPRPDLRKAFTINDRFRFRRELFAGDDAALVNAIDRLSSMNSIAEADAYLASMPWESDSEAVGEFMAIISNHFSRL